MPEIADITGYVPDMAGYKMPEIDISGYKEHVTHRNASIAAAVIGFLVVGYLARVCVKTMRLGNGRKDGFAWERRGAGEGLPW